MPTLDLFGVRFTLEEELTLPQSDNDNWGVASDWQTPAEALQWVTQRRKRLCRELTRDASLWACAEHRLTRTIALAMEKCARWHYFSER